MKDFIKKQSLGSYLTLAVLVLSIISFIVYGINVGANGYFYASSVTAVIVCSILEIITAVAIFLLAQLHLRGTLGRVLIVFKGALQIMAAVLPAIAFITFIDARVEGLGFIFFSNEEILATIQTAENLFSANSAIVGFVFYGLTWLTATVAAFFCARHREHDEGELTPLTEYQESATAV